MQQIAEIVPLVLFVATYFLKGTAVEIGDTRIVFDGFYSATIVLMIATTVTTAALWRRQRQLEKRLWFTCGLILVMGTLTLLLQNNRFLMWKPSLFNWGLAVVFLFTRLYSRKSLLELSLGKQLDVPHRTWKWLDVVWITHFTIVGTANLVVAYRFSEAAWMAYKLYSALAFTLVLSLITAGLLAPHLKDTDITRQPRPDP